MYPGGLRHIRPDRRVNEWRAPGRKTIARAATNERQVAIALSGGELIYFELNPQVSVCVRELVPRAVLCREEVCGLVSACPAACGVTPHRCTGPALTCCLPALLPAFLPSCPALLPAAALLLCLQGMLVESEKREMGGDVACLDLAPVPEGRQRGKFLAVGMYDGTVRVLSLEPDSTLKMLGTQVGGGVCWGHCGG